MLQTTALAFSETALIYGDRENMENNSGKLDSDVWGISKTGSSLKELWLTKTIVDRL